ncbi:hypothetical protein [uncultured Ruegeria sp.]|uniref:hypothetical protein n=1 Tax=uncultured Ruegeria sp. TaxID=259304 RepID=UPI0026212532|nr:hypothetical protein [uncultured Ruegeria sp.]
MRSVIILALVFVVITVVGPMFTPYEPAAINIPNRLSSPTSENWLGTDALGRDILSRLLYGARWSLGLAFLISLMGLFIGTVIGLIAALGGKWLDGP